MYILPILATNGAKIHGVTSAKRTNQSSNILNNTVQDTVSFGANNNIQSCATDSTEMSKSTSFIVQKGYEYKAEIKEATDHARMVIADVLEENGFDSRKFPTGWDKNTKMDSKFEKFLNDPRIEKEHLTFDEYENKEFSSPGKVFDVITLPSKKHPEVTVKISRQVAEPYYYGGWNDPDHDYNAYILYKDEHLELTGADWTNNSFKSKDGTKLVFGYTIPEKKEKQMLSLGKEIEYFELYKKAEDIVLKDINSRNELEDIYYGRPYTIQADDLEYNFMFPSIEPILESVTINVNKTPDSE